MPRNSVKLTKRDLDALSKQAQADPTFNAYIADSGQPGLYAWVRRGGIRFVFAYRPPAGGSRVRMKIDEYPGIPLEEARSVALEMRVQVANGIDPRKLSPVPLNSPLLDAKSPPLP